MPYKLTMLFAVMLLMGGCMTTMVLGVTRRSRVKPVYAAVQGLLPPCRPAKVIRFVVAVVVNSINAHVFFRSWANVLNKICKTVSPTGTNRYSAPPVPIKIVNTRNFTTIYHGSPC